MTGFPLVQEDRDADDVVDDSDGEGPGGAAPPKASSKKQKAAKLTPEEEKIRAQEAAELELLMLDEAQLAATRKGRTGAVSTAANAEVKLTKKQRIAQKKAQRAAARTRGDSDDDEDFDTDLQDPRFTVRFAGTSDTCLCVGRRSRVCEVTVHGLRWIGVCVLCAMHLERRCCCAMRVRCDVLPTENVFWIQVTIRRSD